MDAYTERENYIKVAYILLEVIPKHLRSYFITLWNSKYPDEKWKDDTAKRDLRLQTLLVTGSKNQNQDIYTQKILTGNEKEWDTTTLVNAILHSNLKLLQKGCRPSVHRSIPLLECEEVDIIRGIQNSFYGHVQSMTCTDAEIKDIMISLKSIAKNRFDKDAEKEIENIESSQITLLMAKRVNELLEELKDDIRQLGDSLSGQLEKLIEPISDQLKENYKHKCEKHSIHTVDENCRIVLKEVRVNEFAVRLETSDNWPTNDTFRDEARRHLRQFKGNKIELSELINNEARVTFIRGIAGIGKSVLTKKLTLLWANSEIYTQFKLCIMMECRVINNFVSQEGAGLKRNKLFSEFLKSNFNYDEGVEECTLFIVDGLDELLDVKDGDSIIWQLLDIKTSKYAKAKIILTGRPHVEKHLDRVGKEMGGVQKVELKGFGEEQINEYVNRFVSCEKDHSNIMKTIEFSEKHLPLIYSPQILNFLCCAAIFSDGEIIGNTTELYAWTLYLHLKQHVEKEGPSQKLCFEIFKEYSNELVILCEICHELLNENKIIFEGSFQSRLCLTGKGKGFLRGLFVDVSDNSVEKYQFNHLTLMEFLSAVHVCGMKNRIEIIGENLKKGFYEVVLFISQLIVGYKCNRIIKYMGANDEELKAINIQEFLPSVLELVSQCIDHEQDEIELRIQQRQLFKLSIDIVLCFMNKDVSTKKFIISTVKALRCDVDRFFEDSMRKVGEICENLINVFNCDEKDLKETFENVLVGVVTIYSDAKALTFVKYLPNVKKLELSGMKMSALLIRKGINELANCQNVDMFNCELVDDDIVDIGVANNELQFLWIERCTLNKNGFINLCNWVLASSVTIFKLWDVSNIEHSWWEELADAISNQYERKNGSLALKKLNTYECTQEISEEMEMKIVKCGVVVNGKMLTQPSTAAPPRCCSVM